MDENIILNKKNIIYKISFDLMSDKSINNKFYYSILGGILNLLDNNIDLYNSILSISPLIRRKNNENGNFLYGVNIYLSGKENFNKTVSILTSKTGKLELNLNGYMFELLNLRFDVKDLTYNKEFSNIFIKFNSPTYIKSYIGDFNYNSLLPEPKKIFLSILRKYLKFTGIENIDIVKYNEFIQNNIFPIEFDIKTLQVKIKKGLKAGIVGEIKYGINNNIYNEENNLFLHILRESLIFSNYSGIGSGNKLGLGNINSFFDKK